MDAVTPSWQNWYDHTYHFYGEYDAKCTAVDTELRSSSGTTHVSVWLTDRATIRSFSVTPDRGDAPLDVSMVVDATSTNSSAYYVFSPGDGEGPFATNNSWYNHTYDTPGLFAANCTVVGGTGNATIIEHVRVWGNSPPVITDFTADHLYGDAPLKVTFTVNATDVDADISTIDFDFHGDGSKTRSVNATLMNLFDTNGTDAYNGTTIVESSFTYFAEGTYTAKCNVVGRLRKRGRGHEPGHRRQRHEDGQRPGAERLGDHGQREHGRQLPHGCERVVGQLRHYRGELSPRCATVREFTASVVPGNVPTTYRYTVAGTLGGSIRVAALQAVGFRDEPALHLCRSRRSGYGRRLVDHHVGRCLRGQGRQGSRMRWSTTSTSWCAITAPMTWTTRRAISATRRSLAASAAAIGGGMGSGGGGGGCTVVGDDTASPGHFAFDPGGMSCGDVPSPPQGHPNVAPRQRPLRWSRAQRMTPTGKKGVDFFSRLKQTVLPPVEHSSPASGRPHRLVA